MSSACFELKKIPAPELSARLGSGEKIQLVDVRSEIEFEGEHIKGALNIPLAHLRTRVDGLPEDSPLVLVCRTGVRAVQAANLLAGYGLRPLVLEGGVSAWRACGLPLSEGLKIMPIERQVQLTVGLLVLASVCLGVLLNPWFLCLAAFVGAGLTFAGLSGTCGLALLLAKAPWNQRAFAASPSEPCPASTWQADKICVTRGGESGNCSG